MYISQNLTAINQMKRWMPTLTITCANQKQQQQKKHHVHA
jgi:hypothetical protein